MGLARSLNNMGYETEFLSEKIDDIYNINEDIDVLISFLNRYDIDKIKTKNSLLIKIAWVINWFEWWVNKSYFESYDIVLVSNTEGIKYIEKNYSNEILIDDICAELNINKCYFCSVFKKEIGLTFINYLNNYKIEKSKELLKNPNLSLLDISLSVGYNNQSYFSTVFKKTTSKTPLEFREDYLKNKN